MENKHANAQVFKHSLNHLILLLFIFLYACSSQAQAPLSSQDKKAIKQFSAAKEYYQKHQTDLALESLKACLLRDNKFIEAHTLMAYIHLDKLNYNEAKASFSKALAVNPRLIPNNAYFLGELELKDAEYDKAIKHFEQFLSLNTRDQNMLNRANDGLERANFSLKLMENPVDFKPVNLGPSINSEHAEYFPCLTVDGNTLLFTRRLPLPESPQGFNEDFYLAKKENDKWNPAQNIGLPINTQNNEGAPSLSADGQLLIFTACEIYGNYGGGRRGLGSCDLFYTSRNGNQWRKPINLGNTINSNNWETQPSFSSDGKTLYFIRGKRNRTGNRTGDIYVSSLNDDGSWSKPEALGPQINTLKNEESVFIHPDGKTLYFSSNGHLGLGGLDIFRSIKQEDGSWSKAENLGYPINSNNNENSLLVSSDGKSAYFASDREDGYGDLDLYQFDLPKNLRPEPVTYFAGTIFDKETKAPLAAKFELIDLKTGKLVIESYSSETNGEFLVSLPLGHDYALNASRNGYLFYSENFSLSSNVIDTPVKKDVPLTPIQVGESIVLKNIFFETGSYQLKESSKIELNKLVEFLQKNVNLSIEIGGHTDTVGNPSANQELSNKRAEAVKNFLTNNQVAASRLQAKGYGQNKPIASNDSEKGRAKNRRTEFTIVGL